MMGEPASISIGDIPAGEPRRRASGRSFEGPRASRERARQPWIFLSFVHRWVDYGDVVGGEQVRPYELFTALAAAGHKVRIYERHHAGGPHLRDGRLCARPLPLPARGVLRRLLFWPVLYAVYFFELLRARRSGARLCLYQTLPWGALDVRRLELVPAYVLFRLAGRTGAVTWGALQDLPLDHFDYGRTLDEQHERAEEARALARKAADVQMKQVRHAHLVSVVSENMRRVVVERTGIDPLRAVVFRSSVNPAQMNGIPPWEPPRDRPWRIGFLGHAADAQLPLLIEAMRRVECGAQGSSGPPRVELVLAGSGTPDLEVEPFVRCFGDARYADFARFAREMDLWVIPYGDLEYLHLAWQLKPPMYVASGRPVVMTETDETKHSGLAPYLYLAGSTAESIAAAIEEILRDPIEARRRARAGRAFLLSRMTWRQTAEALVHSLDQLAG